MMFMTGKCRAMRSGWSSEHEEFSDGESGHKNRTEWRLDDWKRGKKKRYNNIVKYLMKQTVLQSDICKCKENKQMFIIKC